MDAIRERLSVREDSPRQTLLRLLGRLVIAALAGYALGAAAYFLDHAADQTGLARRMLLPFVSRGLTATAPARLERYQWHVEVIPEKDYRTGERVKTWPELLLAYETRDGSTRRLHVRGRPNNTDTPQMYMARFAGIFGLPRIDFIRSRHDDEYESWLVESSTDRAVEQLALMWAAPSPPVTVRHDPGDPARAMPAALLDAYARPLSRDPATWIEAAVLATLGAAMLWKLLAFVLRPRRRLAFAAWVLALGTAPFWTGRVEIVADLLGVSRTMAALFGRSLVNPAKIHRIEVAQASQPVPAGSRWSLAPEAGGRLLARLAPPRPGRIDLLAHNDEGGLAVAQQFSNAVRDRLLALPDDELAGQLDALCEPRRGCDFVDMLRPALERLAADAQRPTHVRERANALATHRAFCR